MEKLIEVSEPEVRIDFSLNCKCRCNLILTSLCTTSPVAFKVQTSSPHKFLVNPPNGLVPPSSQTVVQIILKAQNQLPLSFPRSHSDRFLIKTAQFDSDSNESLSSWLSTRPTQDIKLKVAFVGPFLLRHAVAHGELAAVRNIIKRQKSVLYDLPSKEAQSLLCAATHLADSEAMVSQLLDAGLRIEDTGDTNNRGLCQVDGLEEFDRTVEAVAMIKMGDCGFDWGDKEGRMPPRVEGGKAAVEDASGGDWRSSSSRIVAEDRGCSALVAAPDRTNVTSAWSLQEEIMATLARGEEVLMTTRRGELEQLGMLIGTGTSLNYSNQYGLTALHAAALKSHRDVLMLVDFGFDVETKDQKGHKASHMAVEGGHLERV